MPRAAAKLLVVGRTVLLSCGVIVAGGSGAWYASARPPAAPSSAPAAARPADKVDRDGRDGLRVPRSIADSMGLSTDSAANPTRSRRLAPFQGVLALDTNRSARVHSRFAGEVTALGTTTDPTTGSRRPLRDGDTVKAGDLLAEVWSKDLGVAKSTLVDALSLLKANRTTLDALTAALKDGAAPAARVRDAERAVQSARVAVSTAERTLRTYRLTDAEVQAVREDADRLSAPGADGRGADDWARVEVRAAQGGLILEKNLSVGDIVDTTANLFYLADLSELMVWVHLYEEDLPAVQALPRPVGWTLSLPALPGRTFAGTLEQVKPVIDPTQHTALAVGRVANPDGLLKVGQFVTATVELPPPVGEVELPAASVVEDGKSSVVFVQPDPAVGTFVRHAVTVRRRFSDVLYAAADPSPAGVKAGDRVVTAGALLLRDALDQLPPAK